MEGFPGAGLNADPQGSNLRRSDQRELLLALPVFLRPLSLLLVVRPGGFVARRCDDDGTITRLIIQPIRLRWVRYAVSARSCGAAIHGREEAKEL